MTAPPARTTPLHDWHLARGGRLVDFAGWSLPMRYGDGPVAEHRAAREAAALFDVGHMGIVDLVGTGADAALETLAPTDVVGLADGRQRYTVLTNADGGVIDDLMVSRLGDRLTVVVNAARREVDVAHLRAALGPGIEVRERTDLALIALQGPATGEVLAAVAPGIVDLWFLDVAHGEVAGVPVVASRSGYTGEDGVELQVPVTDAVAVADALAAHPAVSSAGLAARDSLRLEAGLCLYGHELDESTSPVEAGLTWSIPGRRRREGGFLGADVVLAQLAEGPPRHRVGLRPLGRRPVRDGAELRSLSGEVVGAVTSGGFGPTVDAPVAMAYVAAGHEVVGTELVADVRGHDEPVVVAALPFVPLRYRRRPRPEERP